MAELQPPVALENVATLHADDLRNVFKTLVPTEGVGGAGDLAVTANGTPNMTVIVAAGAAFIQGDDTPTTQGTYYVKNDAAVTLTVTAAHATNPRIDIVIAEVRDTQYGAAADDWRLRVVAGTAAASPTAPAVPSNSLKLATISVPALDTTISQAQITDNTSLAAFGGLLSTAIPAGVINAYAGPSAPAGWLLCDGAAVSRSTYSALYAAVSTTYGAGDGTTTFNVPNLKGKMPVGIDTAQAEFDALGETGGEKAHILTLAEVAAHDHGGASGAQSVTHKHAPAVAPLFVVRSSASGFDGVTSPGAFGGYLGDQSGQLFTGNADVGHTHPVSSAGSGTAHNNLPPYMALHYIIKAT